MYACNHPWLTVSAEPETLAAPGGGANREIAKTVAVGVQPNHLPNRWWGSQESRERHFNGRLPAF